MLERDTLEACFVELHLRIISEGRAQFADDSGDVCIGGLSESIVGPLAVATRRDESGATKISEVARDFWLVGLEDFNARADAEFIVTEQMNQPQPCVVGQCLEE